MYIYICISVCMFFFLITLLLHCARASRRVTLSSQAPEHVRANISSSLADVISSGFKPYT